MRLNKITLKKYDDNQKFKNIRATYSCVGDRLLWEKWTVLTKAEILEEREKEKRYGRTNLRWDGDLVEQ
jgi:hypothetical protein